MNSYKSNVCFDCMYCSRRNGVCPNCHKDLVQLNSKTRVPKKKPKEWKIFREYVRNLNPWFKQKLQEYEEK